MTEVTSVTSANASEVELNRENGGNGSKFLFSALSTPSGPGGLPLRPIFSPKSALKGHQRSASHGGVATRPLITGKTFDFFFLFFMYFIMARVLLIREQGY